MNYDEKYDWCKTNPDWVIVKEERKHWWSCHWYWIHKPFSPNNQGLAYTLWGAKRILRRARNPKPRTFSVVYRESA